MSPCLPVSLSAVVQQAFARLQAQKIAQNRYVHDRIVQKRKEAAKEKHRPAMSLEERVRRIYGIDMPKGNPNPKGGTGAMD